MASLFAGSCRREIFLNFILLDTSLLGFEQWPHTTYGALSIFSMGCIQAICIMEFRYVHTRIWKINNRKLFVF